MHKSEIKEWKKAKVGDYAYVVQEIKSESEVPSIIFLEGKVGAGKTTFTKHFIGEDVQSPTYSIINEYDDTVHADFYRIKDSNELYELELGMYLDDKDFFLAEWGYKYINQLFSSHVPEQFHYYLLEINQSGSKEDERDLVFSKIDPLLI